jgi:hypothetical protein
MSDNLELMASILDGSFLPRLLKSLNGEIGELLNGVFEVLLEVNSGEGAENRVRLVEKYNQLHINILQMVTRDKKEYVDLLGDVFCIIIYMANPGRVDDKVVRNYILGFVEKLLKIIPEEEKEILLASNLSISTPVTIFVSLIIISNVRI